MVEANTPYVIFGDLSIASYINIIDNIMGKDGKEKIRIKMKLSPTMMVKYNVKPNDLDPKDNTIIKEYDAIYEAALSRDPINPRILLLCDFEGKPTQIMEKVNKKLLIKTENLMTEAFIRRIWNIRLQHENKHLTTAYEDYITPSMNKLEKMKRLFATEHIAPPPPIEEEGVR